MTVAELREALDTVGLGEAFGGADLGPVARTSSVRRFAAGDVLWRAGTDSRGLYGVLEGRIRVVRARAGRQHLVHVSRPGETMGEVALFGGGAYPATAIAAETSACLVVPRDVLVGLVTRDASLAHALLERMAHRTNHLVDRLEAQTLGPVRARLAASLIGLADDAGGEVARIGESQTTWAEALGTVREVLARELRVLREAGLVEKVDARTYRIVDASGLEAIACGRPAAVPYAQRSTDRE
jgi:CRP/FNR family transcriptional regulator